MTTLKRVGLILGSMASVATLSACGVSLQEGAEPLPSNALPAPLRMPTSVDAQTLTASPTATPTEWAQPPFSRLRLWFVEDDGLAAVETSLPLGSSPDLVLQSLAIGPTPSEADQGLRTVARDPLTGQPLVFISVPGEESEARVDAESTPSQPTQSEANASVTVTLTPAFSALPPSEQVLLLGQVVLSLTGAGARSVSFVDDGGALVAVPLPDGRVLDRSATARDYAPLIVRP